MISNCLGIHSSLTYLDLSDNFGGLDPRRIINSEGISSICNLLPHTLELKVLKLARNHLSDNDLALIFTAVESMTKLHSIDVSGNMCILRQGAAALEQAITNHSLFDRNSKLGLRDIDISNNFLLDNETALIARALAKSSSIVRLNFSQCSLSDNAVSILTTALIENYHVIKFDIFANPDITRKTGILFQAEVEANNLLNSLTEDPLAVDCNELSNAVYNALRQKLQYLPANTLTALYGNESFTVHSSDMYMTLQTHQPPPREKLLKVVKLRNENIHSRLNKSEEISQRLAASRRIYHAVMLWYKDIRSRKKLKAILEEAKRKEEMINSKNFEDELFHNFRK